jgi:hypothetical protein
MKYTVTKDAEAEIEFEGKEGNAGETPRTVVEVRPSDVASPRANATTMMMMRRMNLSELYRVAMDDDERSIGRARCARERAVETTDRRRSTRWND